MKPSNVLFILSDEHSRRVLGCYGHTMIQTPNLDRLAARGVRFSDAYTNSPICVPSRASLATGRYPHQIRFWDNGIPYDGSVPSWHHRLRAGRARGRLDRQIAFPQHRRRQRLHRGDDAAAVVDGIGDPMGWLREPLPVRKAALRLAKDAGRGNSSYQDYDGRITDAAVDWLKARAAGKRRAPDKPWALFVSLVCPHFPLIARPEWYDLYPENEVPLPALYDRDGAARTIPMSRRSASARSTKGLCRRGQSAAGARRLFRPGQLYRPQCRAADRCACRERPRRRDAGHLFGRPRRQSRHPRAVGQIDDVRGIGRGADDRRRAGTAARVLSAASRCRWSIASRRSSPGPGWRRSPTDRDLPGAAARRDRPRCRARGARSSASTTRPGAATGAFMIRKGRFKYVYYAGMPPQLFDLDADPQEARDLAGEPGWQGLVADCERDLRRVVDPEAADALAKRRPAAPASPPMAGARRSSPAAASPIRRRRERKRSSTDLQAAASAPVVPARGARLSCPGGASPGRRPASPRR